MEKDDQALGMIQLWLSHSLYSLCGTTSWHTWKNLEEQFGKPGAAMIFADFKALCYDFERVILLFDSRIQKSLSQSALKSKDLRV